MHVLNLTHNKSHSNFVWFNYSVYHKNSEKYLSSSYTSSLFSRKLLHCSTYTEHRLLGRGVNYCHALPRLRELCSATESCWARTVGHVMTCCKEGHQGSKSQTSKKHKSQAFDFRDLFHIVPHNTQIGVVIHIRVIHGSNPQQNVGPFTCPLFECLPLFTNMLVFQPKSWGDFRDISATEMCRTQVLHGHTCYVFVYMYYCWQEAMGIDTATNHLQLCCNLSWITPNIRYPKRDTMGCLVSLRSKNG